MSTDYEENKNWKNWSESIDIKPGRIYEPTSVEDVIAIVREAARLGKRVKATGAGWSFSDVMATDDFLVRTHRLQGIVAYSQGSNVWGPRLPKDAYRNEFRPDLPEQSGVLIEALRDEVLRSDRRLVHLRAGTRIGELYNMLDRPNLFAPRRGRWTLPTMGGASGQTVAGALSTGTHGGHFDRPPMADMVRAIHLIGPDGTPHWIERAGANAITDPAKMARALPGLEASSFHYDDKWFDASLVSLGNFGIIVEYVLEVREQYGLSEVRHDTTWKDLEPLLRSGEIFTSTRYSARDASKRWIAEHSAKPDRSPSGLSVFINPYRRSDDYAHDRNPDRRAILVTHAESKVIEGVHDLSSGSCILDQMHLIGGFEHTNSREGCRVILDQILDSLRSDDGTEGKYRVSQSVLDTTSNDQAPVLSLEIVVTTEGGRHVDMVNRLLEILDSVLIDRWNRGIQAKFAGGLNLRFTRPTRALLGMQYPTSTSADERFCHIEVIVMREQWVTGRPAWGDGSDYTKNDMENYTEDFTDAFERATDELGARLHWGQLSRTRRHDPDRYPRFDEWLEVRSELTNNDAIRTFENDFSGRHLRAQHDIALRAANGKYIAAEGGGGRELVADRSARREWETFKLIHLGGDRVALRAHSGHYVAAEGGGGGQLIANRREIRAWETFRLIPVGEGQIALRAANGQYVVAEGGGGRELLANRNVRRGWETFTIEGESHDEAPQVIDPRRPLPSMRELERIRLHLPPLVLRV